MKSSFRSEYRGARYLPLKVNNKLALCHVRHHWQNTQNLVCLNFINVLRTHFLYNILAPKITKPNITREKLLNLLTYEKCACKMLMKLTPDLPFTQIKVGRFAIHYKIWHRSTVVKSILMVPGKILVYWKPLNVITG